MLNIQIKLLQTLLRRSLFSLIACNISIILFALCMKIQAHCHISPNRFHVNRSAWKPSLPSNNNLLRKLGSKHPTITTFKNKTNKQKQLAK